MEDASDVRAERRRVAQGPGLFDDQLPPAGPEKQPAKALEEAFDFAKQRRGARQLDQIIKKEPAYTGEDPRELLRIPRPAPRVGIARRQEWF